LQQWSIYWQTQSLDESMGFLSYILIESYLPSIFLATFYPLGNSRGSYALNGWPLPLNPEGAEGEENEREMSDELYFPLPKLSTSDEELRILKCSKIKVVKNVLDLFSY